MDASPATAKLHQDRRLEQTCRSCGRTEAAGSYCTRCFRPTAEADWYRNGDMASRNAARADLETPTAPVKRGPGRPRKSLGVRAPAPAVTGMHADGTLGLF